MYFVFQKLCKNHKEYPCPRLVIKKSTASIEFSFFLKRLIFIVKVLSSINTSVCQIALAISSLDTMFPFFPLISQVSSLHFSLVLLVFHEMILYFFQRSSLDLYNI